jgi:hypothetical protein
MTKLSAGTPVKSGYYFSLKTWTIHPMETDGEQLPGATGEQWIPMSLPFAVAAAPLLGAGFLMFLPAIGFYVTAKALARPVLRVFRKSTDELAATMSPGLVPGEAYLTGKRADEAAPEAKAASGEERELDALQGEIDAKRGKRS